MPDSFMKAMIDALRTKPDPHRYVYKDGQAIDRGAPPQRSMLGNANKKVQYDRYVEIQNEAGETPVSYREWLGNQ